MGFYFGFWLAKTRERNQRRGTTSLMIDNSDQMFLKPKGHSFETIWVTVSDRLCLAWCDRDATVTSPFFSSRRPEMEVLKRMLDALIFETRSEGYRLPFLLYQWRGKMIVCGSRFKFWELYSCEIIVLSNLFLLFAESTPLTKLEI